MIRLPCGFRFNPTEQELIGYYLKNKILRQPIMEWDYGIMIERELYGPKATPWELFREDDENLPWQSVGNSMGNVSEKILYVFTKLTNVGVNGGSKQKNRVAGCGTWHGNTAAKDVRDNNGRGKKIGSKRMFTFQSKEKIVGRWIMYEYAIDPAALGIGIGKSEGMNCEDYVLCRIKRDESRCPKRGRLTREMTCTSTLEDNPRSGKKQKSNANCSSVADQNPGALSVENDDCQETEFAAMNEEGNITCGTRSFDEAASFGDASHVPPPLIENAAPVIWNPNLLLDFCYSEEDILIPNLCSSTEALLNNIMNWPVA